MKNDLYIPVACAIADGAVPEWIHVLPMGRIKPKGHSEFSTDLAAFEELLKNWSEDQTDLVVDYEHQSLGVPHTRGDEPERRYRPSPAQ